MSTVVTPDRWLALAAYLGTFSSSRFGFTPRPETRVWGARTLQEHLFHFCLQSGYDVVVGDKTIHLVRGSFLWIMSKVRHETRLTIPKRAFRNYYLRFRLTDEDGVTPVRLEQDWIFQNNAWHILPYLRDLVQELQSPQTFHERRLRSSLVVITASAIGGEAPRHVAVFSPQQRLRLQAYMDVNAAKKMTPQNLADEVGLSLTYFRRLFHRTYGTSPTNWIVRHRILLAATMLSETEFTGKEIAYRLGYCDRFLFSRQFKQVMGVSPRQFRHGGGNATGLDSSLSDVTCAIPLRQAIDANIKLKAKRSARTTT